MGTEAKGGVGATSCLYRWVGYGLFREMGRPAEGHIWGVLSGFCVIHMKFSYLRDIQDTLNHQMGG